MDDYDEGDLRGVFRSRRDQLWSCCDVQAVESCCDTSPADGKGVGRQLQRPPRSTDAAAKDRGRQLQRRPQPPPPGDDSKGPVGVTSVRDDYSC